MPDLPHRPRAHRLEREGRTALDAVLPESLLVRHAEQPEYGIDGEVEVFDPQTHTPTGTRFYFQLKSTDAHDFNQARKVRLKTTTANYMRSLPLPVLIFLYHSPTESLYARWFHHYDSYYESSQSSPGNHRTIVFHIRATDELSTNGAMILPAQADAWLTVRFGNIPQPLPLHVVSHHPHITSTQLVRAMGFIVNDLTDLITLKSGSGPSPESTIITYETALETTILDTTSFTVHQDFRLYGPSELAYEACSATAMALMHAGAEALSLRVAMAAASHSRLIVYPDLALYLASALKKSRRYGDALSLASVVANGSDDHVFLAQTLLLVLIDNVSELGPIELSELKALCEQLINKAAEDEDTDLEARMTYNLGKVLIACNEYGHGFRTLNAARRINPDYANYAYYWRELGGALVLAGHPVAGAWAYRQALQLDPANRRVASNLADALFLGGNLDEAYEKWAQVLNEDPDINGNQECRLKMEFISALRGRYGYESKVPPITTTGSQLEPMDAEQSEEEKLQTLFDILSATPLDGLAWFNLGVVYNNLGDHTKAAEAFKAAALLQRGDVEAWVNALFLSPSLQHTSDSHASDLAGLILEAACIVNREYFVAELERVLEAQGVPAGDREELLNEITGLIEQLAPGTEEPIVRMFPEGEEGPIELPIDRLIGPE